MVTRLPSHQKNTPLKYDTFSEAHLAQKLCAMMAVKFCGMLKCICGQAETEFPYGILPILHSSSFCLALWISIHFISCPFSFVFSYRLILDYSSLLPKFFLMS